MGAQSWIDRFYDYLKRNITYIVVVWIIFLAIYGVWIFNDFVTFDAEGFYSVSNGIKWYEQWILLERWSLVLLKKILQVKIINPFFSAAVFVILFPFSSVLWNFDFSVWIGQENNNRVGKIVFDLFYLSSPIWAFQFNYRNQLEVISIEMVLLPIMVLLMSRWLEDKKKIFCCIISLAGIVFCFAGYQAFLVLYLTSVIFYFFLQVTVKNIKTREFYYRLLKTIVFSLAAFCLYKGSSLLIKKYYHISGSGYSDYLLSQILWGSEKFSVCIKKVALCLKQVFLGESNVYTCIYFIEFVIAVFIFGIYCYKRKRMRIWTGIIIVGMFLAPLSISILTGGQAVIRQQFSYAFSVAAIGMIEINAIFYELKKRTDRAILQVICICLVIIGVVSQIQITTRLLYSDYKVAINDKSMMTDIYETALEKGASPGDAIVFTGVYWYNSEDTVAIESTGVSYFSVSDSEKALEAMQAYGLNVSSATQEQVDYANSISDQLACWPNTDAIYVEDGLIIVRMS